MKECKHENTMEDGYYQAMWCNECENYIEYEEYEKLIKEKEGEE
ncbi:hypothetical protein QCM11_11 [Bacillus phage QCM11]|uniref:Uncharacterized protein n=1 Tax=Bacillus phage QCM11 TaxID=1909400 RepID=A0A1I9S6M6_9CAUD|nr:hypothetical protein H3008_gp11 [Bacillus phage QCM11]AOZ62220.1 hypothetical protein QCM11_11 [Bacillus phage QCM11]